MNTNLHRHSQQSSSMACDRDLSVLYHFVPAYNGSTMPCSCSSCSTQQARRQGHATSPFYEPTIPHWGWYHGRQSRSSPFIHTFGRRRHVWSLWQLTYDGNDFTSRRSQDVSVRCRAKQFRPPATYQAGHARTWHYGHARSHRYPGGACGNCLRHIIISKRSCPFFRSKQDLIFSS